MPEPGRDPDCPILRQTALIALIAGVVISGMKFAVFAMSNSAAVLSDALESLVNVAAAAVMLVSLAYVNRPPDREHRYGHGNAQFLAIAFEGAMVLFAGVGIIVESVRRLIRPAPIESVDATFVAMLGIAGAVGALGIFVYWRGRRMNNRAVIADGMHLLSDVVTTLGAIIGLLLVRVTGLIWIDSLVAALLGAVILVTGWKLVRESFMGLMDRADERDLQVVQDILNRARDDAEILGYHKLRVRRSGPFAWVDMHLQAPATISLAEAHEIASRIEGRIERELGGNATAHMEPGIETS